jgi:hypothetical protein
MSELFCFSFLPRPFPTDRPTEPSNPFYWIAANINPAAKPGHPPGLGPCGRVACAAAFRGKGGGEKRRERDKKKIILFVNEEKKMVVR